jgi:hypothetical protein
MRPDALYSFIRLTLAGGALVLLFGGLSCSRGSEPEANPLRQKVVGHWIAGRAGTASADLELNQDGTFQYSFDSQKTPALKLTGVWTIDDEAIVGQINSVENGGYKLGDTFPFGKIVSATDTTLKLGRDRSIDEYRHPPAAVVDSTGH